MSTTTFERVKSIASSIFGVPAQSITAASGIENVESWDSTQHLIFILALEETFALQLSPEETERIRTVGQAAALIEEKLHGA